MIYRYISPDVYWAIDTAGEIPIYRQIMRHVMDAIAGGRLTPGDQLLSHRDLSERLGIAPLTVKKAYDELESLGYIESQRGRGTFVALKPPRVARSVQAGQLAEAARALLSRAYLAGMDYDDVLAALEAAARELRDPAPTRYRRKGTA